MPDEDLGVFKRLEPDPKIEETRTQDVIARIFAEDRAAQVAREALSSSIDELALPTDADVPPMAPEIEEPVVDAEPDEISMDPVIEETPTEVETEDISMSPEIEVPVSAVEADRIQLGPEIEVPAVEVEHAEAPSDQDFDALRLETDVWEAVDEALSQDEVAAAGMDTEAIFEELRVELGLDPSSPEAMEVPEAELSKDIERRMALAIENRTAEELRHLDDLLGQTIEVRFREYWEQAIKASPRARELMEEVVAGTASPSAARNAYDLVRDQFWKRVPLDQFERAGLIVAEGRAPVLELADGSRQVLTLEHLTRLFDDPSRAIDPSNLIFSLSRENSVFLEDIRRIIRRRFKELGHKGRDPWDE